MWEESGRPATRSPAMVVSCQQRSSVLLVAAHPKFASMASMADGGRYSYAKAVVAFRLPILAEPFGDLHTFPLHGEGAMCSASRILRHKCLPHPFDGNFGFARICEQCAMQFAECVIWNFHDESSAS